jgi:hypothetical protein
VPRWDLSWIGFDVAPRAHLPLFKTTPYFAKRPRLAVDFLKPAPGLLCGDELAVLMIFGASLPKRLVPSR